MAEWTCEIEGTSIVLLGNFNPSIFHPAWLAANNLIRADEAETAKIGIIAPQVAQFTVDWINLEVTQERFLASTTDSAHYEPLRDLVLGIFTLLEHTRFNKMGINRDMHYRIPSLERWHGFGDLLVPKSIWEQVIPKPGLKSLTVQGIQSETPHAEVNVKVEPSTQVHPGVYISINNHHKESEADAAKKLMSVLRDSWSELHAYATRIANHLIEQEVLHAARR